MKRSLLYPAPLVLAAALAACVEQPVASAVSAEDTATPLFLTSECGGRTTLLDSRVQLDWVTQTRTIADGSTESVGVAGDGRSYVGNQEGVHGKIFYHDGECSRSGDMVFDPDMQQKNGPRKLVFYFPSESPIGKTEHRSAPFINFRQLMQLGSDLNKDGMSDADGDGTPDSRDQKIEEKLAGAIRGLEFASPTADRPTYPVTVNGSAPMFRIGADAPGCETLEYESITLTRIEGLEAFLATGRMSSDKLPMGQWEHPGTYTGTLAIPAGKWVVTGKRAQCHKTVKGKLVLVPGGFFDMPFSATVTEIRQ